MEEKRMKQARELGSRRGQKFTCAAAVYRRPKEYHIPRHKTFGK